MGLLEQLGKDGSLGDSIKPMHGDVGSVQIDYTTAVEGLLELEKQG